MFAFTRAMGDSLSPLRIRPLRLYLGGQAISVVGTFMQATAQSWLVWKLSHSTTMLGLVALLSTLHPLASFAALPLVYRPGDNGGRDHGGGLSPDPGSPGDAGTVAKPVTDGQFWFPAYRRPGPGF